MQGSASDHPTSIHHSAGKPSDAVAEPVADITQTNMFGAAAQTAEPKAKASRRPKAQGATEQQISAVFDHLVARNAELRKRLKLKATTFTLNPKYSRWISDRIGELGPGDAGVQACLRAIDVQAKDAERAGTNTKANGWLYFTPTMFSYADPMARKADLWSEDGDHRSFGFATAKPGEKPVSRDPAWGMGSGVGSQERMAIAAKEDSPENRRAQALVASRDDDLFGEHDEAHR
jgi:hypothetical protein